MSQALQYILVVDDKETNLFALRHVLKSIDCTLIEARNGNDALIACLNYDFALAILDVNMPGMDGFELAEFMRKEERSQHTPIIFLSAATRDEAMIFKGYDSGAVDYIVKPYDPHYLLSKVLVFLDLDRTQAELRKHRDRLDQMVSERTAELERVNEELHVEIDRHNETEIELKKTVEALQRSNDELEQFAYIASHDLKAPLRTVRSFLTLLASRNESVLDEKSKEYIKLAVGGAQRMRDLIESLLLYSRAGTRAQPLAPIPLKAVVDDALEGIGPAIFETDARIHVGSMPQVQADPIQISQVFQNLFLNAITFQQEGVRPEIAVTAERRGEWWEVVVADNGIGIEPKFYERVFTIFKRLHNASTYPGTGIGLAIVKKIVERHGGRIWIEANEGGGSRFHLTLPAVPSDD
jgi:signal transduction histidine kinase